MENLKDEANKYMFRASLLGRRPAIVAGRQGAKAANVAR